MNTKHDKQKLLLSNQATNINAVNLPQKNNDRNREKIFSTNRCFQERSFSQKQIKQGYLSSVPERTVREDKGDKAFLTIKNNKR
jgi:hypothetical protein